MNKTSTYHSKFTGSTSCGVSVEASNSSGAFYPQCSATNPNTEVAYCRFATLLGYENFVQEAALVGLAQDAIDKIMDVIDSTAGKVAWLLGWWTFCLLRTRKIECCLPLQASKQQD